MIIPQREMRQFNKKRQFITWLGILPLVKASPFLCILPRLQGITGLRLKGPLHFPKQLAAVGVLAVSCKLLAPPAPNTQRSAPGVDYRGPRALDDKKFVWGLVLGP